MIKRNDFFKNIKKKIMEKLMKNIWKFVGLMALISLLSFLMVISQYLVDWLNVDYQSILKWLLLGVAIILQVISWNYLNLTEKAGLSTAALIASFIFETVMLIIVFHLWWLIILTLAISAALGICLAMESVERKNKIGKLNLA